MAQAPAPPPPPAGRGYSILAICVGTLLIGSAFLIAKSDVILPFTRLLMYSGVAALFAGIGSVAAVNFSLPAIGQAGAAGGAAAIAIALCATINIDPPAKLNMTYYIRYADINGANVPEDVKATVQFLAPDDSPRGEPRDLPITRAPGGDALRFTILNVSSGDFVVIRLYSSKEKKGWVSAAIHPTEGFIPLSAESGGEH